MLANLPNSEIYPCRNFYGGWLLVQLDLPITKDPVMIELSYMPIPAANKSVALLLLAIVNICME